MKAASFGLASEVHGLKALEEECMIYIHILYI